MSLAHLIECIGYGETMSFKDGYAYIYSHIQEERIHYVYQCEARHIGFEQIIALVAKVYCAIFLICSFIVPIKRRPA